ncbi:MAG TPA: prepilin peptidase [Chthoniobacterales bacterium]
MTHIALLVVFPALMAYAAASDLVTMTIPNRVSLALIAGFAAFAFAAGLPWNALLTHLAAGAIVLTVCFGMFAFRWIGGGDAKLAAATALWFGFDNVLEYLLLATIWGGGLTLFILSLRTQPLPGFALKWGWVLRLHAHETGVPYGIALAGAALAIYPHSPIWTAILSH